MDYNGDGKKNYATDCTPPAGSPVCDPNTKFCPGCRYKMIAGPGKWQDTSPGNYLMGTYLFEEGYLKAEFGRGAAISILMLFIVALLSVYYVRKMVKLGDVE